MLVIKRFGLGMVTILALFGNSLLAHFDGR
jgi:hypothetical protein